MTRFLKLTALAAVTLSIVSAAFGAEPAKLTVQVDKPSHKISPTLYGIFYEEINCSGDGGIYPELVRNRSFEDSDKPDYWATWPKDSNNVTLAIDTENPSTKSEFNKKSLKVELSGSGSKGVTNEGWWGMGVNKGEKYNLSLYAKGDLKGDLTITLQGAKGEILASTKIGVGSDWKQFKAELTPNATDAKATLVVSSESAGAIWLDFVTLIPAKTWKNHGLRPDLAEMLNGLKPAFVRFPGGCWVEGNTMAEAQRWKTTIGPIEDKRTQHNIWGYEATNGLGFHEYLVLCEDLGSEPLFVINCGMSHGGVIAMDKMDEFVQDALDAIEYANGPIDSKWGAVRAKAGHPKPFDLKYMEIGNENGGSAYNERWPLFVKAIKAKYPDMHLIANVWGGVPEKNSPEIIDEHYYSNPEFFINNANKYDTYDRKGPKIYVGEYAVTQGTGQGSLRGAVGEAAFMCGMERNSDIVTMSSYAPLFVNINHRAWNPNLIDFDSSRVYGIPSYYVQQMFSQNKGDVVLPVTIERTTTLSEPTHGAIGLSTWVTEAEFKDVLVTKGDKVLYKSDFSKEAKDWQTINGDWKVVDGALRQTALIENARATFGDTNWKEYTFSCKARKIKGEEGFLLVFYAQDKNICAWWNVGGWRNTQNAIEWNRSPIGKRISGNVEAGRWYDVKVDLGKDKIRCYLDGKLIQEEAFPSISPLHSTASRDEKTGDIIVKVVNAGWSPQATDVTLAGAKNLGSKAEVIVLTSANGMDENSIEQTEKIKPKTSTIDVKGTQFKYDFPANSVTVMRFKAAK